MDASNGTSQRQAEEAMPSYSTADTSIGISPEEVSGRRDLARYLSQSLIPNYVVFDEDSVKQASTYLKSYIVESHSASNHASYDGWSEAFTTIVPTKDPTLFLATDKRDIAYFVDTKDARFSLIHSIGRTENTDATTRALTEDAVSGFDRAWLPSEFMLGTHIGMLRGFKFSHEPVANGITLAMEQDAKVAEPIAIGGTRYENLDVPDERQTDPEQDTPIPVRRRSSMTVKDSNTALSDYQKIQKSGVFESRQSLDWIQYRAHSEDGQNINHGLYSNGKVVANGTSIALHLIAVDRVRERYGTIIRWIEDECAIGWHTTERGTSLRGEPLIIRFSDEVLIHDLQLFAHSIFRTTRPFRLFGIPHRISDDRIDIEAIDLHTGDEFSVELTRQWMRIFLPRGSCGNLIARLYTNLLHSLDSDTRLVSGSGELVFSEK